MFKRCSKWQSTNVFSASYAQTPSISRSWFRIRQLGVQITTTTVYCFVPNKHIIAAWAVLLESAAHERLPEVHQLSKLKPEQPIIFLSEALIWSLPNVPSLVQVDQRTSGFHQIWHSCLAPFWRRRSNGRQPWSDPLRNPMEQRHGDWYTVDTRQTLKIDNMPWCRRSDSCEALVWPHGRFWIKIEILRAGRRRVGTRLWNCVGRCSHVHSDDEYGPDSSLQLGTYANSTALRAALLQGCCSSRNFGANPTASSGNGTNADDDRMQVDSLKKGERKDTGKNQHQRGNRTTSTTNTSSTDINTCKNCGKPGHWAKDCWNPCGGA